LVCCRLFAMSYIPTYQASFTPQFKMWIALPIGDDGIA
jgi:hypothetical protein